MRKGIRKFGKKIFKSTQNKKNSDAILSTLLLTLKTISISHFMCKFEIFNRTSENMDQPDKKC